MFSHHVFVLNFIDLTFKNILFVIRSVYVSQEIIVINNLLLEEVMPLGMTPN
jgi:hypothetical protein